MLGYFLHCLEIVRVEHVLSLRQYLCLPNKVELVLKVDGGELFEFLSVDTITVLLYLATAHLLYLLKFLQLGVQVDLFPLVKDCFGGFTLLPHDLRIEPIVLSTMGRRAPADWSTSTLVLVPIIARLDIADESIVARLGSPI